MPRPLLGGGGRRGIVHIPRGQEGGGLLVPQGRRRQISNTRSPFSDQQWNVVIQFSARHLFCPAHATTATTTAVAVVTKRVRSVAIDALRHSTRKQLLISRRQLSTATALASDPSQITTSYSRESGQRRHHINKGYRDQRAQGDTADPLSKPRSSESATKQIVRSEDQKENFIVTNIPNLPSSSSSSSSSPATKEIDPTKDSSKEVLKKIESLIDRGASSSTSSASASASSPHSTNSTTNQDHSTSWSFPTSRSLNQTHYDNSNRHSGSVRSWALAGFYSSLHQLQSSFTSERSSRLRTTLSHYNFLSQQQLLYDTPLITRKDTRTLFVLQAREPKTRDNLDQLLRISTDLIWLNEKDRQMRRRGTRSSSTSSTRKESKKEDSSNMALDSPYVYSPSDDYHGLRVSEYTILMNWIGSVASTPFPETTAGNRNTSSLSPLSPSLKVSDSFTQCDSSEVSRVDRVWSIWNDFLSTGMKPDVVLYTSLLEILLKAKEYERASQIWELINRPQEHQDKTRYLNSQSSKRSVSTLNKETDSFSSLNSISQSSSAIDGLPKVQPGSNTAKAQHLGNKRSRSRNKNTIPNLQTFSVLMEMHVQNKDLQGVAHVYNEFLKSAVSSLPSSSQLAKGFTSEPEKLRQHRQRNANTVLLNQILTALLSLGENKAAEEIYQAVILDCGDEYSNAENVTSSKYEDGTMVALAFSSQESPYRSSISPTLPPTSTSPSKTISISSFLTDPESTAVLNSTPLHHQNSQRRSTWEKLQKLKAKNSLNSIAKNSIPLLSSSSSPSPSSPSPISSQSSSQSPLPSSLLLSSNPLFSIKPDKTTHRLILELAKRKGDHELQNIAIRKLQDISNDSLSK
ncbi:hypothetical protein BGZ49_005126 [Haplosporangium sp. Z 27]|nr:hypothetical protein BGZ49_005126 [Haplosporangium sp. Z 27]